MGLEWYSHHLKIVLQKLDLGRILGYLKGFTIDYLIIVSNIDLISRLFNMDKLLKIFFFIFYCLLFFGLFNKIQYSCNE